MIKFGESGNATLHVLAGPSGQGHETVLPEVVGEILGLPAENIALKASDPEVRRSSAAARSARAP